ncbi:hypothetical protein EDD86DRAFT_208797 [Gorgonomyces haynaldii]|nr:hypothetical protein EDD86DRAFT_208797 [Gorgonomyces haynaldii]
MYDILGQEIWNTLFPMACYNPDHQVMDIRNGILMWTPLNARFDKFAFTIIKKGSIYEVEALRADEMENFKKQSAKQLQITVAGLNGKQTNFDDDKGDQWPSEPFLRLHNAVFCKKGEANRLKAQAEAQEMKDGDSAETFADEHRASVQKVLDWNPPMPHLSV